jgi:hypothetical protein
MSESQFIIDLLIKERQRTIEEVAKLQERLDQINDHLTRFSQPEHLNGHNVPNAPIAPIAAKGSHITWSDYVYQALKSYGKKAKARDLVDYLIPFNPNFDKDSLFTQVRHHLSKLGTNNKIKSERAGSGLKEGNWYSIK